MSGLHTAIITAVGTAEAPRQWQGPGRTGQGWGALGGPSVSVAGGAQEETQECRETWSSAVSDHWGDGDGNASSLAMRNGTRSHECCSGDSQPWVTPALAPGRHTQHLWLELWPAQPSTWIYPSHNVPPCSTSPSSLSENPPS